MKGYRTIREASVSLGKCPAWIRAAARAGKIKSERVGRVILIPDEEVARIKKNMIVVSRSEMSGK